MIVLSPLALVFWLSARINSMSVATARNAFLAFAALIGLSMSALLVVYTGASFGRAFFATAAAFASLSLYGYTTQRSLSAMGSFMMMGVVGLIIASLLNVFLLHSTGLQFGLSILCVIIFAGLTAWDTQAIKEMYFSGDSYEMVQKKSIHGALRLYLDFINMFQAILMLTGISAQQLRIVKRRPPLFPGSPIASRGFLFDRISIWGRQWARFALRRLVVPR